MPSKMVFITISSAKITKQNTFEIRLTKNSSFMVSNKPLDMIKPISFLQKIILNPYIGICISLLLIIPSLYVILEDVTVIRKEYLFLAIGIPIYIKSLNKIFDDILNLDKNIFK